MSIEPRIQVFVAGQLAVFHFALYQRAALPLPQRVVCSAAGAPVGDPE